MSGKKISPKSGTKHSQKDYHIFHPEARYYRPTDPRYVDVSQSYPRIETPLSLKSQRSQRPSQQSQASTAVSTNYSSTAVSTNYSSTGYASSGYAGPTVVPDGRDRWVPPAPSSYVSTARTESTVTPRNCYGSQRQDSNTQASRASRSSAYTDRSSSRRQEVPRSDYEDTVLPSDSISQASSNHGYTRDSRNSHRHSRR